MSTDRREKARHAGQAGFTFIEVAVTMAIMALIALVVERTLAATHEAERYLDAVRRVTERGQKVAYEVLDSVSASRKLFEGTEDGIAYFEALDLTRDVPAAGIRLPLFDEVNPLGPDEADDPRTGNTLLFVRESDPAPCVADPATGKIRYVDTYRFICIYPHTSDRRIITGDEAAQDLVMWRSIPFPSYAQIEAIDDEDERRAVVADLYGRFEYEHCWDPNGAVDASFFQMDQLGNVAALPVGDPVIYEDENVSDRGRLVYANVQLARTDAESYARRAVLTADDPAVWKPDGFEVKMTGASGARKVWIHLVVEAQAAKGRVGVHENTLIASTRDL